MKQWWRWAGFAGGAVGAVALATAWSDSWEAYIAGFAMGAALFGLNSDLLNGGNPASSTQKETTECDT